MLKLNPTDAAAATAEWQYVAIILTVWPDLEKFRHFVKISPLCQNFQSLWAIFWMSYLVFGKLLSRLWHFYATGQIFIVVNGQRLHSNKAIWSHCPALNTKTLLLLFSQNVCLYSRNILLGTPQTTLQPVWPDWVKKVSQTLSDVLGYFENKPSLF